jgi:hypothetical protein
MPSSWGFQLDGEKITPPQVSRQFSGAVAGEEKKTSARGVFHTHILNFVICFALLYLFLPASFYQKPKKIRILDSCFLLICF